MSQIFYSNVDANLQKELNARGLAGKTDRSTEALNFMLGKIANARVTAYSGPNSRSGLAKGTWNILGGETVREGKFLPGGENGYLSDSTLITETIVFNGDLAELKANTAGVDTLRRTGPYLTSVDITVGDHSMGLLNKATLNISIPNPDRDLEDVESIWFYPGRFVRIELEHPDSAVITKLKLTETTLPKRKALLERYKDTGLTPDMIYDQIDDMNRFTFEGLITSFDFSYTDTGQIDATLSLTGTSNVFTDITMFMSPDTQGKKNTTNDIDLNPDFGTNEILTPTAPLPLTEEQYQNSVSPFLLNPSTLEPTSTVTTLYKVIQSNVDSRISQFDPGSVSTGIIPYRANTSKLGPTDQYILYGRPYDATSNDSALNIFLIEQTALAQQQSGSASFEAAVSASVNLSASLAIYAQQEQSTNFYHRYITLGALISEINKYILIPKISNSVDFPSIICDDIICFSNYLEHLTSCIPDEILLLPTGNNPEDMNCYGSLAYYRGVNTNVTSTTSTETSIPYTGIYENNKDGTARLFTSRIFINIQLIESILDSLSENNTKNFTLKNFLAAISGRINYATGGSILLKLMSLPSDPTKLAFIDVKCINTSITSDGVTIPVNAYRVPMFANNKFGTIVQSFTFQAQLPENAKNLSYVLNSGDEVVDDEIAPYMNFMYNSKDVNTLNKTIQQYKKKYEQNLEQLREARRQMSLSPKQPQFVGALWKALTNYLKFPTADIRKSQQLTAPIFPFTVNFTIDGINGLRYGDVLTFDGLPARYRANTVFSITSITHNVSNDGKWTSDISCIMRPKIS